MARETKVGVLTGLAFIICFAIILANRGRQHAVPALAQWSDRIDSPPRQSPPNPGAQTVAYRTAADTGASRPDATNLYAKRLDRDGVYSERAPQPPVGGPTSHLHRETQHTGSAPSTLHELVNGGANGATLHTRSVDGQPVGVNQPVGIIGSRPDPGVHVPSVTSTPTRAVGDSAVPTVPSDPPATGDVHVVALGETLTKIAAAKYGKKSTAVVNAIYEANRTVITNPDNVPAGTKLILPDIAASKNRGTKAPPADVRQVETRPVDKPSGTSPEPKDSPRKTAKESKESPDTKIAERTPTHRTYQVRKNDRLMNIAKEQLGDASRWKEIYELNRDKFPDPARIREGVKIKLPGAGKVGRT